MARKSKAETVTLAEHLKSISAKGGKARWAKLSEEERQELRTAGGKARAKSLTKKQRSDIAKAAAKARWGKKEEQG
jgi:hypothetical protein